MPRALRVEYAGTIYHVMNRGNQRQNIFREDFDRRHFLTALGEACAKTGWQIHAYCLMRNHFHLVIETPSANLVAGMKWLLGVYTKRFNIRHKKTLLLTLGVAVVVPMVVAPTVSPVYGSLLVAVGSLAAAGVGIVALIRFELISGEPQGKDQA